MRSMSNLTPDSTSSKRLPEGTQYFEVIGIKPSIDAHQVTAHNE